MEFPYGKAPLAILVLALGTGASLLLANISQATRPEPDLIFATFARQHGEAYKEPIKRFEAERGVRIQLQVVDGRALQNRLQAAFQAGADVPDMVELVDGSMGYFTKGPIEDVGFVDLTDRVMNPGWIPGLPDESLYDVVVKTRFTKWSSRGHIFALPHDVHPVAMIYRRDILEELGIDVNELTTWEKFVEVGREVTKDLTGDGVPDRYMIDLPVAEAWGMRLLLLQRGGKMFDDDGGVAFDSDVTRDVIVWYVQQVEGPDRISFPAGWGQNWSRSVTDGLVLFHLSPDWKTRFFQTDTPSMSGKMAVMPLPAWEEGGRRTSTWGGTGLAITKQCAKDPEKLKLAWELAMYLYYEPELLGPRFLDTNIMPPLTSAWSEPEFHQPWPFFSDQKLGEVFATLSPEAPEEQSSPYMILAENKLNEAYQNALLYFRQRGVEGLSDYTMQQLHEKADQVRRVMSRNVFLTQAEPAE